MCSTLGAGAALAVTPAFAQVGTPEAQATAQTPADAADSADSDREIVITGSRIRRQDLISSSPISVVSNAEFKLSGAVNVESVINQLPQALPAAGGTAFSNNPGTGASLVNLRGLGATRTLVLVNGRRYMFYDTSQLVDTNTIPMFLLDSVEVLTGGASAVYGTDAVAGVVNFKLRENLNGVEGQVQYNLTDRGDGRRYTADLALGSNFADGKGNVTLYANYTKRAAIFAGARAFSATASGDGCIVPGSTNSATSIGTPLPSGIAIGTCAARGGQVGFVPQGSPTGPIGTFSSGGNSYIFNPTGGGSRTFQDPADLYNFGPVNYLQLPQERYLMGAYGHYEITSGVEAFTELSFVDNRVSTELAPTPTGVTAQLQIASPFFNTQTRTLLLANDAAEAAATRGDGYAATSVSYRFLSAGSRNSTNDRSAFRVLGGLRGDITPKLNYEAFYSYARTRNSVVQQGNVSRSRYLAALSTEFVPGSTTALQCRDAAARAAGCQPINVFGSGLASQAAVNYIRVQSTNLEISELKNAVATLSGSLFNLGGGGEDVGFSVGGEYRKMSSRFIPDTFLATGDVLGFNASQPTAGSYDVKEAFGELNVPILRDRFIHRLELTGAARISDYSLPAVGSNWTYTAGIQLAPVRDITFRGNYSRAVRAPNVGDLFAGNSTNFPAATDPCSDRSPNTQTAAVRALCVASGVPAANVFTRQVQPATQIQVAQGGNPNVGEETSDTYSFGAVISPTFIPRLNITVDYFNIKVEETIGILAGGVASALTLCYNTVQDVNNAICQPFVNTAGRAVRGPTGALGETAGGLNPLFTSANVGTLETAGIDVGVDYSIPLNFSLTNAGSSRVVFNYNGTWLDTYRSTPITAIPEREFIFEGTYGQPIYRHTARLSVQDGPALLSLRWRFNGKTQDSRINNIFNGTARIGTDPALLPVPRLGGFSLFDLTAAIDATDALTLSLGVNNMFDVKPPVLGGASEQSNTLPGFYDVIGRDFFVSARMRF